MITVHRYLRSIGFSKVNNREELQALINEVVEQTIISPDRSDKKNNDTVKKYTSERDIAADEEDRIYAELFLDFVHGAGICVRGEFEENSFFYEYYFPYLRGNHISSNEDITIERHAEKESYAGVCDEIKIGVAIIFYLQNMIPYKRLKALKRLPVQGTSLILSGLSVDGMIMMPIVKNEYEKQRIKKASNERNQLLAQARMGDEDAIESLTLEDMDTYTMISRKIHNADVFSLVDTYFMPYGVECDQYSILGEITDFHTDKNRITSEEVIFIFKEIVSSYNNAYARSYQATLGVGTPGKGEGQGIKYGLKLTKRDINDKNPVHYINETKLIDMESVSQLDDANFISMADMQSIAGLQMDDAIEEILQVRGKQNMFSDDMISKINDLIEHMDQGNITPRELTVARYLIMLGSIKTRWHTEPQMGERKGIRDTLDATGESSLDTTKQFDQVIKQKQQETGVLLKNYTALGEHKFVCLVDAVKELSGLVETAQLLEEDDQSIFSEAVEIMGQVGEIVKNGILHYMLDIKLEAEEIMKEPIPNERFDVFHKTDIQVIPFLMYAGAVFMENKVLNQTEGAQNLWYLMQQFEEKVEIIADIMSVVDEIFGEKSSEN